MASTIKIKRSGTSASPLALYSGELAYSWVSNTLYVGTGDTVGNDAAIVAIGGQAFTSLLDHTPGQLTASSALIVDANSKLDNLLVDNLQLNGNTLSTTNTNGDLYLTPNGTGKTVISNVYVGDTATSLHDYIQSVSGGSLVDSSEIDITFDSNTGTTSLALIDTTVVAGTYGSGTQIPTFTVDSKGRLTAASTVNVATDLSISGDSGVDTVSLLTDTLSFIGGEGIDVIVTNGTVTVSGEYASSSNAGIATFNTNSFDVSGTGDVTIKSGGVTNSQLANSDITIGTTTVSLGGTVTTLDGLTELVVDNLNINGNEIQSTNANGDIILNPNGTGDIDVSNAHITNLAEPVNPSDAATKNYVDNAVSGLDWKSAVNLLADSNVSLTGSTATLVIDGHSALDSTDNNLYRILLIGQTTSTENGIYTYTDNGTSYTLVRSSDADEWAELSSASIWVLEGVTYASTGWVQSNHYITSFASQNWVQFSGAGAYIAGPGLGQSGTEFFVNVATNGGIEIVSDELRLKSTLAGNALEYTNGVLDVQTDGSTLEIVADKLQVASTYAGQTSITTLGTITTGTWNGDTIAVNNGGTGLTSYATGDLLYASGSTTLAKLSVGDEGKILQVNSSGLPVWGDIDGGTY